MAALKYKDKDGFWQELQVGTNVVANPMLTGTEQELTSLQVGNTKYKSSGGKIYRHEISVEVQENGYLYFYFTDNVQNYSKFTDIPIKKGVGYYTSSKYANCPAVFDMDVSGNMLCVYFTTMNNTNSQAGVQYIDIYKDFSLIHYTDTAIQL